MVSLQYMDDSDFDKYLEWSVKNYASEKVKAGAWPEEGSIERSGEEFKRLLPNGRKSENNHLFMIIDDSSKMKAGILWLGILGTGSELSGAFIWDIMLYPEFRGKGLGKQAMQAVEVEARKLGARRISLHVFGQNTVATSLYRKVGYTVTDLVMSKEI